MTSSPSSPMTRMPHLRMASRLAPRAMKVTSSPAAASHPPTYPPIAPGPTTAIFTRAFPVNSPDRALAHASEHSSGEQRGDEIHDGGGDEHRVPSELGCRDDT